MAGKNIRRKPGAGRQHNYFPITVKLIDTMETFKLKKVYNEMKIKDFKEYAEFATGIPYNIQRISYLDEGDLLEHTDMKSNDIVAGALLKMRVWNTWRKLIEAAALGDGDMLMQLGVTQNTSYATPNSEWMMPHAKREWIVERANIALFIAAHRGHMKLCTRLIKSGADVNGRTSLGRTPLHVAAAQDHGFAVDLLLELGADIDAADNSGETALSIANKFGNKNCERHLFLFRWQQRAKNVKPVRKVSMFAHQFHDSAFPVWLKGDTAQIYYSKITPPSEYQGTALGAPKSLNRPSSGVSHNSDDTALDDQGDNEIEDGDDWLMENDDSEQTNGQGKDGFSKLTGRSMPAIEEETPSRLRSRGSENSHVTDHQQRPTRGQQTSSKKKKVPTATLR